MNRALVGEPAEKSLAEQLQDQLVKMRAKSEAKQLETPTQSAVKNSRADQLVSDNVAWDLTQKLKARMQALHGRSIIARSQVMASRKTNFKK